MEEYSIGSIYKNTQQSEFIIKDILDYKKLKISFVGYEGELIISCNQMKERRFKNPYLPSVFGIGYLGIGKYHTRANNKPTYCYICWKHMMERAYDPKYHIKFPTYTNVTICNDWHNFQNFAEWFEINYIEGYHLDKDLLQTDITNKIYSPNTCVFIPDFLNYFIKSNLLASNTSGYTGVTYDKPSKKWMVTIYDYNRKVNKNLGRYKNIEDAIIVYKKERSKIAEIVKNKIIDLKLYSNDIIQLIK